MKKKYGNILMNQKEIKEQHYIKKIKNTNPSTSNTNQIFVNEKEFDLIKAEQA